MIGQTPYEAWIRRVRDWAKDPDTPLEDLPSLAGDDRITPEVYERLIDHIEKAQAAFMDLFVKRLQDVFSEANEQLLARAYHNLQYFYARRLAFARHPGLPEKLSQELLRVAEQDLKDVQAQAEKLVAENSGRGSVNNTEHLLRIIRQNSLLQVLHAAPAVGEVVDAGGMKSQVNLIPRYDPDAV
jgi:hypothetical protein